MLNKVTAWIPCRPFIFLHVNMTIVCRNTYAVLVKTDKTENTFVFL